MTLSVYVVSLTSNFSIWVRNNLLLAEKFMTSRNVCQIYVHKDQMRTKYFWCHLTQCPRTDLNKISLPRTKTATIWKLIPHWSKISKNWNPPKWVPLNRFFKNWFLLMLYNNYIQTHVEPGWRISILADIRSIGYKLSCSSSLWSRFYLNLF